MVYHDLRDKYPLRSQLIVRCISKTANAYKKNKKVKAVFRLKSSMAYDIRILSYNLSEQAISIWVLGGRIKIPFTGSDKQLEILKTQKGESDLVYQNGMFYLYSTCEVEEDKPTRSETYLGVDLGINNIATDSDGKIYSGAHLNNLRCRHRRLRTKLQKKNTKSSKRLLKHLSGKEKRFSNDVNHCISKELVLKAKGTLRNIALEDLSGIRKATVRSKQRVKHHSWAFYDLRAKIAYKAQLAGVSITLVDPAYTSQMCNQCSHIEKSNRNRNAFKCKLCGYTTHADYNAARNIASRASVNRPYVVGVTS